MPSSTAMSTTLPFVPSWYLRVPSPMFQAIIEPPLPVAAPNSVFPSWVKRRIWNGRNVCRSAVWYAHGTVAPVVVLTAPTPTNEAPFRVRKNPPSTTRVLPESTANARTSLSTAGAHPVSSAPVVAFTLTAYGWLAPPMAVNDPPTYRFEPET